MLGVYCISPVVVFMFVFPLFGGFVIMMDAGSNIPSISIKIHVVFQSTLLLKMVQ